MMIDWVSAKIPLSHAEPIHGGQVISYSKQGEVEYTTYKRLPVEGSYSDKITIRTLTPGEDGLIYFSGNPNKFLQGHNLFGSADLLQIMTDTLEQVFAKLNITPTEQNWQAIRNGQYSISRIDLNVSSEMASLPDVLARIRTIAHTSRSRHKSSGILKGDTLYFGKNSRRWSMKAYAKGQEIFVKGHELPYNLPDRDALIAEAQNKLRWELVLRGQELTKLGLANAHAFVTADLYALFENYKARIVMPENIPLNAALTRTLPHSLRATYALWKEGEDLRKSYSKNTFYKHRRGLLAHGIDISVASPQLALT